MATSPSITWKPPTTMSMIPAKTIQPLQAELRPADPCTGGDGACEDLAVGVFVIAHSFCHGCGVARARQPVRQCAPLKFRGVIAGGPRPDRMTPIGRGRLG